MWIGDNMNLIFMRHGEATDNVKELISDKEIYWSILTEKGIETVKESLSVLPNNIDIMYISPFPRTIQTAHYVHEKYPSIKVNIDNRIKEIFYGKYSHQKNNEELDEIRKKQIAGDYFTRFGGYGDNKYDIEKRLTEFLLDIYNSNNKNSTVLIISHGSITSYMKRILDIKSEHLQKGKIDIFNNVDFSNVFKHDLFLKNKTI
jgi:broad specificity phosphatase PhoE